MRIVKQVLLQLSQIVTSFLVAGTLCATAAEAQSRFYLTVERSYSPRESAEVRVDFVTTKTPMTVRVLKPRSLDQFLEGQVQLARSYEEPLAALNPGNYLVRGMNQVKSPLRVLRNALSPEFRNQFGGEEFQNPLQPASTSELLPVPEEITQGPPKDFEVVRELYIDLQHGGTVMEDTGWWFDDQSQESSRYKVRTLALEPLPDGLYLLQAVQGQLEAQALLQVSNLNVQVKQSSTQLLLRVVDRERKPVSGATARYRGRTGGWEGIPGVTSERGELLYSRPDGGLDGKLYVAVDAKGTGAAVLDTDFLPTDTEDAQLFLLTDRPIFKPGDSFAFKGVIREQRDGAVQLPALTSSNATIEVRRSDGALTELGADVPLTEFGTFSGAFAIPPQQSPGLYSVSANVDGKRYNGEFRIKDYVKPTFYLELLNADKTIAPGKPFTMQFKARRYSGGIPVGTKYEVFVYRQRFELPQFVVESGGDLSAGSDYFGENRSSAVLAQPQRLFSSVEKRLAEQNLSTYEVGNTWDTAPLLSDQGEGTITIELPAVQEKNPNIEWSYTVLVRAMDQAGAQSVLSHQLFMTKQPVLAAVRFLSPVTTVGSEAPRVAVRVSYPDGSGAAGAKGELLVTQETAGGGQSSPTRIPFESGPGGFVNLQLEPPTGAGVLRAVAELSHFKSSLSETAQSETQELSTPSRSLEAQMIYGGKDGELIVNNSDLMLYAPTTVLAPGESVKVLALLPSGWGVKEQGTIWESVAGERIFSSSGIEASGRSRWFTVSANPEYGTGFYQTVTVPVGAGKYQEQTVGFRVVPTTKKLQVQVTPGRAEAEPLKDLPIEIQVLGYDGAPASNTELSVSVVDRAVYAVQPEFRPGIVDFFYPLPRLNLGTFYSDEVQGYGYGDSLKQPNFRLAALKSQQKPNKRNMRDTAGWFPHVVTDGNGRATVNVPMPANITEWLVTAVAVDRDGRLGEGRGRFRTVSDLDVEALVPPFMRNGDTVQGSVQLRNKTTSAATVTIEPRARAGILLSDGGAAPSESVTIDPAGEKVVPVELRSELSGEGIIEVGLPAVGALRIGGAREFGVQQYAARMMQQIPYNYTSAGLVAALPPGGVPETLQVQVSSGLLGAALHSARTLLAYPYGCTEQLVHTTVPNIVLLNLAKDAGVELANLKQSPLGLSLEQARSHAESGISKLLRNQKQDGGFGLWQSDPVSSYPVSVMAVWALNFARQAEVEGAERAFERGMSWLRQGGGSKTWERTGRVDGYQLALLSELESVWSIDDTAYRSFIESSINNQGATLDEVVHALRMIQAKGKEYWFDPAANQDPVPGLLKKASALYAAYDPAAYQLAGSAEREQFGFGFGEPYLIAQYLGVMDHFGALTDGDRRSAEKRLMANFKFGIFGSTFENANVVLATRELLKREAKELRAGAGDRRVLGADGSLLGVVAPIPGGYSGTLLALSNSKALQSLSIEGLRPQELVTAYAEVAVPFKEVSSQARGISVVRELRKITPTGSAVLLEGQELSVGDVVVSKVRVTRDDAPHTGNLSAFVVLEDGIPSFAEGIEEDRTYLADAKIAPDAGSVWGEVKDTLRYPDRTERVLKVVPGGIVDTVQVWRVGYAGTATIPPAKAFDMYNAELQGNSPPLTVQAVR